MNRLTYWLSFVGTYKNWLSLIVCRVADLTANEVVFWGGLRIHGWLTSPLTVITDEVFIMKRYNPVFMPIQKGDIVVDIGAHVGVFTLYAVTSGASKVYSYEASSKNVNMLTKNVKLNNFDNVIVRNSAISDKRGKITLFLEQIDGGNTIINMGKTNTGQPQSQRIGTLKLEDLFLKEKIKKIDFLKIDCEGAEGLILKSTPAKVWAKINKISMEYHDNISPVKHLEIIKQLKSFRYHVRSSKQSKDFGYIYAFR